MARVNEVKNHSHDPETGEELPPEPETLALVAGQIAAEREQLMQVLLPFAQKGAEIVRKRGPALEWSGNVSQPIPTRWLVDAAKALGLAE